MLDETRWNKLTAKLGGPGEEEAYFTRITAAYSEPSRCYHTSGHIAHCLREFDAVRHLANHPEEVEFAIWLHDAVYNPEAIDNEDQSAQLAIDILTSFGCSEPIIFRVRDLVLATREHCSTLETDQQLLLDIDLSILGQPPQLYQVYEDSVRAEYGWVSQAVYRTGRGEVLHSFLSRARIFQTVHFFDLYEQLARRNLKQALAML